ncbi:PilZ domain-containing protein [Idiomarina sp. X4]|uniref:PilZ domain-containing protein n=1 Tax=Idiomarina sp. X4 TaxID=2055892 RepID=UPI000C281DBF|nr:PilZ domain-containing protein [Idiomarina sp. X4]ATZ74464.1 PilZ domain-containing protein [Idiomarina sp. X4]
MLESNDNRNFMRMSINADAKVSFDKSGEAHSLDAVCLDLSAEGLSLKVPVELEKGQQLSVAIVSSGGVPPLKATAEVVHSQRLDNNSGDYLLGCRIISMD